MIEKKNRPSASDLIGRENLSKSLASNMIGSKHPSEILKFHHRFTTSQHDWLGKVRSELANARKRESKI